MHGLYSGTSIIVHNVCEFSKANGPGIRAVVWTQGCSIGCPGCFNAETHSFHKRGTVYNVFEFGERLGHLPVDGLTLTGGEPLDQLFATMNLVKTFRKFNQGTVLLFTGYTSKQILESTVKRRILLLFDAVLAGPYVYSETEIWKGKELILVTNRITAQEMLPLRRIELSIQSNPKLIITGYPTKMEQITILKTLGG
jgi:anaerobic ribonucleoside-triphosphate reductase activating protein